MNTSTQISKNVQPPKSRETFAPTALFLRYLRLSRALSRDHAGDIAREAQRAETARQCEEVAQTILQSPSHSAHAVFEKLYIWRTECFCASEDGYIYSDDQYPLSAYFDMMDIVGAQYLSRPTDEMLLAQLRGATHGAPTPHAQPANECGKN